MTRTPVFGGNWKMHLDLNEAIALAGELCNRLGSHRGAEILIFPSAPFLRPVVERLRDCAIAVGGQDLHFETKGAFTGATAPAMLTSVGCTHALIGHSERRHVFGDDDATVARKLTAALNEGLVPVLCVGETIEERRAGQTFVVIERQLASALAGHDTAALSALIVAYEPVWAIGTGETASPAQAQEVHAFIREWLSDNLGDPFAQATRIQYGGSVKADNVDGLMTEKDIDGALIGGASLKVDDFTRIVRFERP